MFDETSSIFTHSKFSNKLINNRYVHMGGDEVFGSCWNQKPSIKEFMVKMNITDYDGLQRYYRNRQK